MQPALLERQVAELLVPRAGEPVGELALAPSTFTTNRPEPATAAAVRTELLMQASIIGGSADSEVTELAVMP